MQNLFLIWACYCVNFSCLFALCVCICVSGCSPDKCCDQADDLWLWPRAGGSCPADGSAQDTHRPWEYVGFHQRKQNQPDFCWLLPLSFFSSHCSMLITLLFHLNQLFSDFYLVWLISPHILVINNKERIQFSQIRVSGVFFVYKTKSTKSSLFDLVSHVIFTLVVHSPPAVALPVRPASQFKKHWCKTAHLWCLPHCYLTKSPICVSTCPLPPLD